MVFLLVDRGFQVYEATNGCEALEVARKYHPDLILMDIGMPIMDGLMATRRIRSSDAILAHIPIIAVTAFGAAQQEQALIAGCNQVIAKPIDFVELDVALEKYLS